ncbi:hypothetical protein [Ancylobacter oerskovii]|uniref:Holin n=1 Tax=Ancylobacter oerskovii TaxID=459519 RepID=A0ABW4YZS3_9HYPH|nr:hypothetical protein [Ancylobacter oerskovii]MBS7542997.1 hypothetical protein [Ancylobacter oerskovii]
MTISQDVLTHAVRGAVEAVIRSPQDTVPCNAAAQIVTLVIAELEREPAARLAVAPGDEVGLAEPRYAARITLGALVALIGGLYALGLDIADGTPPSVDSLSSQLTAILGASTVLYGQWRARKRRRS